MADIEVLAEQLVNLTVKEVNDLYNFKRKYNIEPAVAPVMVAGGVASEGSCSRRTNRI